MATQPHSPSSPPRDEGAITHGSGPIPPKWETPREPPKRPEWDPKPDLNPQNEKTPAGVYADGMDAATEQRLRSEWIEAHGVKKYHEATFEGDKGWIHVNRGVLQASDAKLLEMVLGEDAREALRVAFLRAILASQLTIASGSSRLIIASAVICTSSMLSLNQAQNGLVKAL